MERIKDISKVEPGDFLNYHGSLSVVASIEFDERTCKIKLDNGAMIIEKVNSRLEFFRTLNRMNLGT
ncbi:MAG TPA: hypothetical protein VGD22_04410 [Sphingobacteriaceae bacterium]